MATRPLRKALRAATSSPRRTITAAGRVAPDHRRRSPAREPDARRAAPLTTYSHCNFMRSSRCLRHRPPEIRIMTEYGLATRFRLAGGHHQGRRLHQRHVRSDAGEAVGAQQLCRVRRRYSRGAERDRHLDRLYAPVTVAYGTCETPSFSVRTVSLPLRSHEVGGAPDVVLGYHGNRLHVLDRLAFALGPVVWQSG